VLFKRKSQRFFSFQYIKNKLEKLIGIEINQNFVSNDPITREYVEKFDLNKILYSFDLSEKIFGGIIT
jgi:hypothetical protein